MKRKLRTALTLSWRDWWNLFQAWVLLLAVDLSLRLLPFRTVQRLVLLGRRDVGNLQTGEAQATMQRLRRLVGMAGRYHLYPMSCLRQTLALQWLLGRCGIIADLRFGVRKEVDGLDAHAWLEYEGQPIGEPEGVAARFVPLVAQGADG
jgi:hypothetical protein